MTPKGGTAPGARAHLRLLATSDLHMHLTGYDYFADRVDDTGGLTRLASLIGSARAEAAESGALTLLFDNGDGMQGTPMGDLATETPGRPHPLMRAFGHLGYDAIGLGNHDFNFGLGALQAALAQAPCPVICSNLRRLEPGLLPDVAPFAVLDRDLRWQGSSKPIRIGVIAFIPPQTTIWDAHLLAGRIAVDDIVQTAQRLIPDLRQAGCDVIVALAHSGLMGGPDHPGMENAVRPLAALDGIDAIVAGHTHLTLPGRDHGDLDQVDGDTGAVCGKPVVMPGSAGSHLGVIDLQLATDHAKHLHVAGFRCALRPVSSRHADGRLTPPLTEDRGLVDLLAPDHRETLDRMRQPVGQITQPLHSYFSFFAPDRAMALVAAAQAAALRPVLAGTGAEGLPLISAVSPCKYGGRSGPLNYTDVPAGKVFLRHVADLHVFPNQLRAALVTGQQVLDWLEMSASLFHQITPGSTGQALVDPAMPGHNFDVLHGLTWQIDLSAPARYHPDGTVRASDNHRILDARHNGDPITADQRFVVALNSYRASGGGQFAALVDAAILPVPTMTTRDIVHDYLTGRLPADPLANAAPPWGFVAMPGTSVLVQTGPGATAHMGELAGRGVKVCGPGPDGFVRLILPL